MGMTEQLGKSEHKVCVFDVNHTSNVVFQSLHTVVLIYFINAPIIWLSKNYYTVERCMLGSECVVIGSREI